MCGDPGNQGQPGSHGIPGGSYPGQKGPTGQPGEPGLNEWFLCLLLLLFKLGLGFA